MQARYYDPVIGRFYSNDPVGFTGEVDTFNRYSYVANNPYKYTDPDGEEKRGALRRSAEGIAKSACKKGCGGAQYYLGPKEQDAYMTRKNAMTQLKKDAGIPKSQQPSSVEKVKMQDQNGNTVKDNNGNVVKTTEYSHTTTDNKKVVIQDHSAGHKDFSGDSAKPHLNVRPAENTRTGKVEGTKEHYTFEKKK